MKVKFKKLHPEAVIPTYANPDDAGMDLTVIEMHWEGENIVFDTGLAMAIPKDHVGLIFPRSSISKKDLMLTNCVGVIDPGFIDSVKFKFKRTNPEGPLFKQVYYKPGDRVGQLIIMPIIRIESEEIDELESSERGLSGWGSSGE